MALDRLVPTSATIGAVNGDDFMDAVQEELTGLWDRSTIQLTSIGGTANAITATATPALTSGLQGGMRFGFVAASTNIAGGVTIEIGSESPIDLFDAAGAGLSAGAIIAGAIYEFVIDPSGNGRIVSASADVTGAQIDRQVFTASGTWTKPADFQGDSLVIVELWGGGGGGSVSGGAGGGGGYLRVELKLSDLSSTVSVTVGPGGSTTNPGSASVLGAYSAYGGGGGGRLTGGTSVYGGNGGGTGANGLAPGGGGGGNGGGGAGARGEVRVTVIG